MFPTDRHTGETDIVHEFLVRTSRTLCAKLKKLQAQCARSYDKGLYGR